MTKPNSLVAQIFKARYYSRTSFAGDTLGHNPSYAWRSIMAGKQVVIEGSRVRIGDGEQTFIGKDPWLPDSECGFVNTLLSEQVKSAPVSPLMVPNTRIWNYDILNDIFNNRDKNLIWQIPLSNRSNADSWYWMHEAKGVYTVRSSYKMLLPYPDIPSSSIWNQLWRLEAPSKVKHFMWRALTNVLATIENLLKKYVKVPPACPICHASSESAGRLKCNVDAAMFASRGYIGLGSVIRDSNGAFVATRCCSILGRFNARNDEALSVRETLSWIKQLQLSNVTIEMDCLNVYNALVNNLSGPSSSSLIIEDCCALSNFIRDVSFSFVRRSANSAAHSVAQAGNSLSGHGEWRVVPPLFLIIDLFGFSS
ncbi:uncharacterized protein LOC107177355 [Citrus sinensis]|uniref:uncharacterized protein LOC107177355 n=1 Tax=Citrus sinensis TaxID=2711 RepID=UPI0007637300|nr:uncharacterized protein LOC107177355 [Citrus sinensis]